MERSRLKGIAFSVLLPMLAVSLSTKADTLTEAVNAAISANPEVLIRTSSADAALDEVRQARAGYLPTVDLTAGIGFENTRNGTTLGAHDRRESQSKNQDRTRREASVILRQMLFDGFATGSEVDRQKARRMSADYELCSIAEDVGLQTARVYIDIMQNTELLDNAQANLAEHQRIVELIRQRGNNMGTDADVAQAESRLLLAHANLIATEASLSDSKSTYQRVVGNLPESYVRPVVPSVLPGSEKDALSMAMDSHPVMDVTMADVDEAKAQYEASKSRFMPTVTAELGADWGKDQNGGKGTNYNHTAMLRMSLNLYNGGADKARKSQTSKLINEATEIRNRAVRQIQEEVRLSWIAVDSGAARLKQLVAHESNARKALDLYSQQFQAGSRTLLDLLDSQNELFSAGNSRIRADYDHIYSQFRLLHSGGVLLNSLKVALPIENSCGLKQG